jgi:hypothetical protein
MRMPPTIGPPKSAEIAEKDPAVERTEGGEEEPDDGAQGYQGRLGAEHATERERCERGKGDAQGIRRRSRRHGDAFEGPVAAVARQETPGRQDECRPDHRQEEHQVPGRGGVAERFGQLVPEPVLQVVDEPEEAHCDERGRNADERPEQDEPEVRPGGRLLLAHRSTGRSSESQPSDRAIDRYSG